MRSAVEHVLAILDRQRNDNEMLLRALATGTCTLSSSD